jgi:hypothetical protein
MYRCTIEMGSTVRAIEIPEWMFDAAACAVMRLAPAPLADVQALLQLRHLLSAVRRPDPELVLEAQHHSLLDKGGADADPIESSDGTTQAISSSHPESSMGGPAVRDPTADSAPACTTAARALHDGAARRVDKAGGMR